MATSQAEHSFLGHLDNSHQPDGRLLRTQPVSSRHSDLRIAFPGLCRSSTRPATPSAGVASTKQFGPSSLIRQQVFRRDGVAFRFHFPWWHTAGEAYRCSGPSWSRIWVSAIPCETTRELLCTETDPCWARFALQNILERCGSAAADQAATVPKTLPLNEAGEYCANLANQSRSNGFRSSEALG